MKLGLHIPETTWRGGAPALRTVLRDVVQAAEAAGFDTITVADHACNISPTPELPRKLDLLRRLCDEAGRDYGAIEKTVPFGFDVGERGSKVARSSSSCAGWPVWGSRRSSAGWSASTASLHSR